MESQSGRRRLSGCTIVCYPDPFPQRRDRAMCVEHGRWRTEAPARFVLVGRSVFFANRVERTSHVAASEPCVSTTATIKVPAGERDDHEEAEQTHTRNAPQRQTAKRWLVPWTHLRQPNRQRLPRGAPLSNGRRTAQSRPQPGESVQDERRRPRQVQTQTNWSVGTAVATISHHPSSSAAMRAAGGVSNSATVRRHATSTPLNRARQPRRSSFWFEDDEREPGSFDEPGSRCL
jgi:hypothetical protein